MSKRQWLFFLSAWQRIRNMTYADIRSLAIATLVTYQASGRMPDGGLSWEEFGEWAMNNFNARFPNPNPPTETPQNPV